MDKLPSNVHISTEQYIDNKDNNFELKQSRKRSRRSIAFFVLFAIIICGLLGVYLRYRIPTFTKRIQSELTTIADLKSAQIADWYEERSNDAKQIYLTPMIQDLAIRYLANPSDAKTSAELVKWMQMKQKLDSYAAVYLFDIQGNALLSTPPIPRPLTLSHNPYIQTCVDSSKIVYADLHRDIEEGGKLSKETHFSFWIPVIDLNQKNAKTVGIWVIRMDPEKFLFPMIQSWPVKSKTAETLLVRREGRSVLYLNELRYKKDTSAKLKFEIEKNPLLPSVMAVTGKTGVVEGIDYRGEKVLAVLKKVPGTPWFIVAKIDKREIYEPFVRMTILTGIVLLLLLLLGALTIGFLERKRDNQWLKMQLILEQEKAKLREESVFLASLLNESSQPFVIGGMHGSIINCNPAYLDLIGYSAEEMGTINYVTDLTPPEWREFEKQKIDELVNTGVTARYEKEYIRKNGERITIEAVVNGRKNERGEVEYLYGFITNITERKKSEQALRMSERKFRSVFENSLLGISLTSPDGTVNANAALCNMLGYTHDELLLNFTEITHPDDVIYTQNIVNSLLNGEADSANFTKRFIHKNGSIVWADLNSFLQRKEDNTPEYFITVIRDITKERMMEEALIESEKRFRLMVERSPLGVYMFAGDEQKAEYVNPTFTRLFGYTIDEIKYVKDWWLLAYPDEEYREKIMDEWKRKGDIAIANQTEMEPIESVVICKNGTRKYISWGFVSSEKMNWAFCVDLTEWRLAQEELLRINRIYSIISQVNQMVVRTRDKNKIYEEICNIAIRYGNFRMAWIGEVDEKQLVVKPLYRAGHDDGYLESIAAISVQEKRTGYGPTGTAARTGKWCRNRDIQTDPRMIVWRDEALARGYHSSAAFPIIVNKTVKAVLTLYSSERNFFTDSEIHLMEEVASDIAFALEMLEMENTRHQSEVALQESEHRFRELFEHMSSGVTIYDPTSEGNDFIIKAMNNAGETITQTKRLEIIGKSIQEVFPGVKEMGMYDALVKANETGEPQRLDTSFYHDDRLDSWYENYIMKLENGDIVAIYDDVSLRMKALEAFQSVTQRLQLATGAAHIGIWDWDIKNDVLFCDKEMYKLYGVSPEQFSGAFEAWKAYLDDEGLVIANEATQKALSGEKDYDTQFSIRLPDGSTRYIKSDAIVIRDENGKPTRMIGTNWDVTDIISATKEIRETQNRLEVIIDNAPFGAHTFELKPDDRLILIGANLSSDTILHIDTKSLIGMDLLEAFPGNKDSGLDVIYRNVARGGENYTADQVAYDDTKIAGAFEIHAMNIGKNRMTVFFRDVTEKKKAEDAIKKLNEELEQRVSDRTAQLEAANKEMEAFSYSVSHDLRAPLRNIYGWSQVLQEDYNSALDKQAREYITKISMETQRTGALIDALLELSHLSRAKIQFSKVHLSNIAMILSERLKEDDPTRKVRFEIQPGLVSKGDSRLLEAVLTNLFSNAWKFTGTRAEAVIEFGKTQNQGVEAYFVRDNGVGFNMKSAQKLFGAFQRMHPSKEFPGTGIGLATVQRIIHSHGGKIWAEAEVDKGATFYFTLKE